MFLYINLQLLVITILIRDKLRANYVHHKEIGNEKYELLIDHNGVISSVFIAGANNGEGR